MSRTAKGASYEQLDWYDAPRYYDAIFDTDTEREADFLEEALARHGAFEGRSAPRKVGERLAVRCLEPACGSGRLMVELGHRGWRCTGFDLSAPMLGFARDRLDAEGLDGRLFEASMQDFALPAREQGRFHLAHCLVSTFKYLLNEADAVSHLQRVARALLPGGIYVLGFHLSDYDDDQPSRERWKAKLGREEVVCNITGWPADSKTRRERVRSRLIVKGPTSERRLETNWEFRTYDARQVRRMLRAVPELELVELYDFTYDFDATHSLEDEQLDSLLILRRV